LTPNTRVRTLNAGSPVAVRDQEESLKESFRLAFALVLAGLLATGSSAENKPNVSLDTSETLFSVLTAINACGYDQELSASVPLRGQIRTDVANAIRNREGGQEALENLCQFYREHQPPDPSHDLSQYVSLALYLQDAPSFEPKVKQAELPPDATMVAGIVTFLKPFYEKVGLHDIWGKYRDRYTGLTDAYHDALSKMTFDTEIYLKLPSAGYLGRQFIVFIDAMGAPGQVNARNYASDYYVVISPATSLKMQEIRHTYLHYLLDPLALKNGGSFKRLEPVLDEVKSAPMDDAFKNNISLLVTECLVRAVETRTMGTPKTPEAERLKRLDAADREGYVLTRYFYDSLIKFEKDPAGLRAIYAEMLNGIDVNKEMRRISQLEFAEQAAPELLHLARPRNENVLLNAERRLAAGDTDTAQKLAQQVVDEQQEDTGRALFILAQIATRNRDMEGARTYFERALQSAHEPTVIAWSHIYLGRIFDLKAERDLAMDHYRAALDAAGNALPDAKNAAQKGIEAPYEPPAAAQRQPQQ